MINFMVVFFHDLTFFKMKIVKSRLYLALLLSPVYIIHILCFCLSSKKELIRSDVKGFKYFIYHLVWDKPFRNVFYYRIGKIHFLFSWIFPRCSTTKISQNMPIGKSIVLEHAINTFLNAESIGDNFLCYHNVTIGQKGNKLPIIGNNVVVSCGACILGNVVIGDNVIIGANCVVVKDVPSNCTVIGNPAHIVKKDGKKVDIVL